MVFSHLNIKESIDKWHNPFKYILKLSRFSDAKMRKYFYNGKMKLTEQMTFFNGRHCVVT